MQILVWTDSDCFAGTERHCLDLALGLRKFGVDVLLGTRPGSPLALKAQQRGIKVLELGGGLSFFSTVFKIVRGLRSRNLDVIHTHNGVTTLLASFGVWLARSGKLVSTQHFITPARETRRGVVRVLSAFVHRWIGRRVSYWVAISDAVANASRERGDIDPHKLRVVRNGISSPDRDEPLRGNARQWLGISNAVPVILCPARLEAEKGHSVLLEALKIMQLRGSQFAAVFIGGGAMENSVAERIQQLELGGCVRLYGHQSRPEVWMRASDVVVLPSPAEPFGLVLVEAMSRGIPVVAARAGGPVEILDEGCGLFFSPGNAGELADAISKLIEDAELRNRMSAGGEMRWRNCFKVERMVEELHAIYLSAVQKKMRCVTANGDLEPLSPIPPNSTQGAL